MKILHCLLFKLVGDLVKIKLMVQIVTVEL